MSEQTSTQKPTNDLVDVSFGLPLYMQQYWDFMHKAYPSKIAFKINDNLSYNFGRPRPELTDAIVKLHKYVGNAETKDYHIIVGAGASQVVSALGYAVAKAGFREILLQPPYWGRLEKLLNMGVALAGHYGNAVRHKREDIFVDDEKWITFTTNPNNPDGSITPVDKRFEVVDMCYNWPQYVKKVHKGAHDVMIFGLSKATGHAGTRIGWGLVKSPVLAEYMKEYIETSTCGVSEDSQLRAASIIGTVLSAEELELPDCFTFAKDKLRDRWARFKAAAAGASDDFKILNSTGMFAWCEHSVKDSHKYCVKKLKMNDVTKKVEEVYEGIDTNYLMKETYGISVNPGRNLGLDFTTSCFRMNLGCADDTFEKLLKALKDGNKIKES